jgi:hypothetical protein
VLEHIDRLLTGCEARRQSLVVEGVHLSLSMVVRLMQRHPSVVPFLVHISNEAKHIERFAVRSKVMTLRPDGEPGWNLLPAGRLRELIDSALSKNGVLWFWQILVRMLFCCVTSGPAFLVLRAFHIRHAGNRYVKYFRNIRAIQDYLVKSGELMCTPVLAGCCMWTLLCYDSHFVFFMH